MKAKKDSLTRLLSHVDKNGPNGCWLWTGYTSLGYGRTSDYPARPKVMAHRFMYELLVGPIPEGMTLDHLCRVRNCVNPDHLEPISQGENVLRSPTAPTAIHARQTHCKRGHEFTPENTYVYPRDGDRVCITCRNQRRREWQERNKAKP